MTAAPAHIAHATSTARFVVIDVEGGFAVYRSVLRDGTWRRNMASHEGRTYPTLAAAIARANERAGMVGRVAA